MDDQRAPIASSPGLPLAAEPASVPAARRYVRKHLASRPAEVVDAAELCISELTTNAVVHAGTQVEVGVTTSGGRLRLEVRDHSSVLPRRLLHTRGAATGRGMEMVTILSSDWGVDLEADGGKVVWCELELDGVRVDTDPDALLATWADEFAARPEADGPADHGVIRLRGYPVRRGIRAREHTDALVRECVLLSQAATHRQSKAPQRLVELAATLTQHYSAELAEPERRKLAAYARNEPTVDLNYPKLPELREIAVAWRQVLIELDGYARENALLTLATPPDVAQLQEWVITEFLEQADGAEPRPWPGPID